MQQDKEFLGKAPIGKLLFQLALPAIAAQIINLLYNLVDRVYIGHIPGDGAEALTGVGVCMPVIMVVLALPAIAAQIINLLYNLVDRVYIGHIPGDGAEALTGVGVCMPVIMVVSAFAALISMGGAPRASIFMGKKDNETAEKILGNCFMLQISFQLS